MLKKARDNISTNRVMWINLLKLVLKGVIFTLLPSFLQLENAKGETGKL